MAQVTDFATGLGVVVVVMGFWVWDPLISGDRGFSH